MYLNKKILTEKIKKFSLKTKLPIILASGSNIRKSILKSAGLKFKIINPDIDENRLKKKYKDAPYSIISKKLAQEKALKVSNKYNNYYVIGADQICVFKKKYLTNL